MDSGNELRRELQQICFHIQTRRPPAIRRSLKERFLYVTDLPQAAEEADIRKFTDLARRAGWEITAEDGWLQMDKVIRFPPREWYSGRTGPEAACCRSMLQRHSDRLVPTDGKAERMLVKAAEQGTDAYEAACRDLHRIWAERLRKGTGIPDVHPDFFKGGTGI